MTPHSAVRATLNIGGSLSELAERQGAVTAICQPRARRRDGGIDYERTSYRDLDGISDTLARGLRAVGIGRGVRTVLMVPPGRDFFNLAFAMAKAGAVPVVVDPGMGVRAITSCLRNAAPEAFIGIPKAHLARVALGWGRGTLRQAVTVGGPRWLGGLTLAEVERAGSGDGMAVAPTDPGELAAILFTSGSTGTPKGVAYTHANLAAQVEILRSIAGLGDQEIDLPTFALFALFDPALGMTTVVPELDFAHPAKADPARIAAAIQQERVTNMFCSVAILDNLARWGARTGARLPTLRRVICAGAPVPVRVLGRFVALLEPNAHVVTPYGATEALPVTTIRSDEILGDTQALTLAGAGVCVGRPVPNVEVAIIPIGEEAITAWHEVTPLAVGEIGEIVVRGPVVTSHYWGREEATRLAKIPVADGTFWHRMGDVGYLDARGRLWFCGRKAHRVQLEGGRTLFPVRCEGVFNAHPDVRRSALVGVRRAGRTIPVLCVELERASLWRSREHLVAELRELGRSCPETELVADFLFHPGLPVDARHNAKIRREIVAPWAERKLG